MSQDETAGEAAQVALAAVVGAHGIQGEVRLKLFAEGIESLQRHPQVRVGGRTMHVKSVRPGKHPTVRFAEISDRDAAEALRGSLVTVTRSELPPLDEGEYYYADLIGLECRSAAGEPLGTVATVENFGAGDILEIELTDGSRVMVLYRDGVADLRDGRIVVDPQFLA